MTRHRRNTVLFCISVTLAACGGGEKTPVTSTPATPTPGPIPSPTPVAFSCPLPPSTNPANHCFVGHPQLGTQVNSAIDRVMATRPELFNMNDLAGGNPRVLDRDAYWQAVKSELEKQGVCTIIESEEFAIKTGTNAFNEQWNIWASSGAADCTRDTCLGFVRRRYVTSCEPAWF
jgi:hypothetical protein